MRESETHSCSTHDQTQDLPQQELRRLDFGTLSPTSTQAAPLLGNPLRTSLGLSWPPKGSGMRSVFQPLGPKSSLLP